MRSVATPIPRDGELTLDPQAEKDLDALVAILREPSVARWWGPQESDEELRESLRSDDVAFTIRVDGDVAGWLNVWSVDEPDCRWAALDIFLGPNHQDRGIGPRALRLAIDWLIAERGHHRFTIDPDARTARAIRAYEKVGFRRVGTMRAYERGADGTWHDGLLLDLLADELPPWPAS